MSQSDARARGLHSAIPGRRFASRTAELAPVHRVPVRSALLLVPLLIFCMHVTLRGQSDKDKSGDNQSDASRVRIEVTGGDAKKPVADASVYLKFVEARKLLKDRKIEFNLKTNQEGIARSPEVPKGKILIQIVADGWKPYGEYFELDQDEQTIQIHLVRPTTKWY